MAPKDKSASKAALNKKASVVPKKGEAEEATVGEEAAEPVDRALVTKHVIIYAICGIVAVASIATIVVMTLKYMNLRERRKPIDYPFLKLRNSMVTAMNEPEYLYKKPTEVATGVEKLPALTEQSRKQYNEKRVQYKNFFKITRSAVGPWQFHGKSLYYFSKGQKNWYDAENFCISKGAHLASILNNAEQNFISSQAQHPSWIGLTVEDEGGKWTWSDGSRLVKEFWSENQPSSYSSVFRKSNQDCGIIVPSLTYRNWKDNNCHKLYRWVCKENLDLGE